MTPELVAEVMAALEPLPTEGGGLAVVLASSGPPPALALLSSGDVLVEPETVRAVVYGGSEVARRLGGSFSLLVPAGERAYRVEVRRAHQRQAGNLHLLEGELSEIRPTAEPPWLLEMSFRTAPGSEVGGFLDYWESVRSWLKSGAAGDPPPPAV